MQIVVIETPELGDRSYLVHAGGTGFVVDPQRDIDRMLGAIETAGVRLSHVFETHIHNDYVTGGWPCPPPPAPTTSWPEPTRFTSPGSPPEMAASSSRAS